MTLDYSSSFHYLVAMLPEVVVFVGGMGVLLAGVLKREGDRRPELGWATLGVLAAAAVANGWLYSGVSEEGATAMIAVDKFRLFANWIFLVGAALSIAVSLAYVSRQRLQAAEYYALIAFATVGMMVIAAARDLMIVFLGMETMSIAVYALVAFNRRDARSAEAGLKYFLLGAFASGFLLFGIALVYGATGSTNLHDIAVAVQDGAASNLLMIPGAALLIAGFAFKVSAVPFHMWTPDAYEGAPLPVTAFMASVVKAAAFVALARILLVGLDGVYDQWMPILWWLAAVTMVVGNLVAVVQSSVKRMLAYSSIAHGGYLLVALVAANDLAAAGLLFYLLVYTVTNIGAFAVVITVGRQSERNAAIESYGGYGWRRPVLGVLMTLFLLSLAGFPGTGGFMAKFYLLQGAAEAHLWWLLVVLVLTTVVSYWYYLRVAWFMWMKEPPQNVGRAGGAAPLAVYVVLLLCAGLVMVTGLFPGAAIDFAQASVEGLRDLVAGAAGG